MFERQQKRRPYCANAQQITLSLFSHCFTFLKENYFLHLYILYLFLLIMSCSICVHITQFLYYIFHLFQVFKRSKPSENSIVPNEAMTLFPPLLEGRDEKCSRAWTEKSAAVKVNRENAFSTDRCWPATILYWLTRPAGRSRPTALFYWTNCTFPISLLLSMLSMLLISKIAALVITPC